MNSVAQAKVQTGFYVHLEIFRERKTERLASRAFKKSALRTVLPN